MIENLEFATEEEISTNKRIRQIAWLVIGMLGVFLLSLGSDYLKWAQGETATQNATIALYEQINPKGGYTLPVSYVNMGPRLIESGMIDYDAFAAIYTNADTPLPEEQINILKNGSSQKIVINAENAHYLLNFFWAVGLVNQNRILTEGAMIQ